MESLSQGPLFKNVYQIVDKDSGNTVDQGDGVDMTAILEKDSHYSIKPVRERQPIIAQYESFYKLVPKKPQSQCIRKRPKPLQQTNNTEIEEPKQACIEDFLNFSTQDGDESNNSKRALSSTQLRNQPLSRIQYLQKKQKISLYDLKDSEVLSKIKQRCITQNPHQTLFSNPSQSRNDRLNHHQSLDNQPKKYPLLAKQSIRSGMLSPTQGQTSVIGDTDRTKILQILGNFERKQQFIDTHKFTRDNLKLFLERHYKIQISEMTAIEGIHYCRGKMMERSQQYSRDKLVDWLVMQIPILQTSSLIQDNIAIDKSRKMHALTQHDEMVNSARGIENEQNSVNVDEIIQAANMNSKVKQKLVNTLVELETQVIDQQSRQGMLGQVAAQQRLSQKSQSSYRNRRQEVQRQLIETCHYDSAVRSINLSRYMNPSWSETPNSYQVVSKLSQKQKRRLNEMTHKRLEFK